MTKYGTLPKDLGLVDINPTEMMCWLYCPISVPGSLEVVLPQNLAQFADIVLPVLDDIGPTGVEKYVYITAKTLFVTPDNSGNRPGWHSDGFMTDDINYVWSDSNPTVFWKAEQPVNITQHHTESMKEMTQLADTTGQLCVYADKHLLKLDQRHIHKVAERTTSGMRTFVKISVSKHLYAHVGNSINHDLDFPAPTIQRSMERNCPATGN
jgi:hypothetical protein